MADTPLVIRVAANLAELRANLAEGVNEIETTSSAMKRMATAYDGSRTISEAGAVMAAIGGIQNVTSLTTAEQAKANTVLEAALAKYQALGREAPPGMQALADATKATHEPTMTLGALIDQVGAKFGISTGMLSGFLGPLGEMSAASAAAGTALAAVVAGAYELTMGAVHTGEEINTMSEKLGISAVQASQLRFAVVAAGGNVDTMSNAVFMMSKRLEDTGATGEKARAALTSVGLSAKDFLALPVDEKILAVSDAFRAAAPSALEVSDLFGRQGREILPVLLKAMSDLVVVGNEVGATWTDVDAKAAEELGIKTRVLGLEFEKLKDDVGMVLVPVFERLFTELQRIQGGFQNAKGVINDINETIVNYVLNQTGLLNLEVKMPPVIDLTTASRKAKAAAVLAELDATISHAAAMEQEKELIAAEKKVTDEAAAAAKKHAEALAELAVAGIGWQGTLAGMNGVTVDAVRGYLEAGVSQSALAEAYSLTATQIKAVVSFEKDQADQQRINDKAILETTKLWDAYDQIVGDGSTSAYGRAQLAIDRWAKDLVATMQKAHADTAEFYAAINALVDAKHAHELQITLESDINTHEHFVKLAADAQQAYDFASAHAGSFSAEWIMHLQDTATAADFAAREWTGSLGGALDTIGGKADTATDKIKGISSAMNSMSGMSGVTSLLPSTFNLGGTDYPSALLGVGMPVLPHDVMGATATRGGYADGVENAPGGWSTVGERGPEQMYVPRGSTILPNGSGAGGGITIAAGAIVINGSVLSDKQQLAAAIGDALMARARSLGRRMPA